MPKISAVGLFCLYKFENNQTRTCTTFFRMSKLTEPYFNIFDFAVMRAILKNDTKFNLTVGVIVVYVRNGAISKK